MSSPDIRPIPLQPEHTPPSEVSKEVSQIRAIAKVIFLNKSGAAIRGHTALYQEGIDAYTVYHLEERGETGWAMIALDVSDDGISIAEESGEEFSALAAPHVGDINEFTQKHSKYKWQTKSRPYQGPSEDAKGDKDTELVTKVIRSLQHLLDQEIEAIQERDDLEENMYARFVRLCRWYPEAMQGATFERIGRLKDKDTLLKTLTDAGLLVGFTGTKNDIKEDMILDHGFSLKRHVRIQTAPVDLHMGQDQQIATIRENWVNLEYNPVLESN